MKKTHQNLLIVVGCVAGLSFLLYQASKSLGSFGGFGKPDETFGQQHLTTSAALLELHRARTGSYPDKLSDIEFTGAWDPLHTSAVKYCPSKDHARYYLEVSRGWIGKPTLEVPGGFWEGTGYDPALAKECK